MLKNSSRSKTVGPWSSWSSEGPLKVPLSRAYFRILAPWKRVDRARNVRDSSPPPWSIGRGLNRVKKEDDWRRFRTTIGPIKKIESSGTIWSRSGRLEKKQSLVKCSLYKLDRSATTPDVWIALYTQCFPSVGFEPTTSCLLVQTYV